MPAFVITLPKLALFPSSLLPDSPEVQVSPPLLRVARSPQPPRPFRTDHAPLDDPECLTGPKASSPGFPHPCWRQFPPAVGEKCVPPRKPNFVGANSPRPALSATAIAIFRARDLTIPAISSRTFSGSNCLPDVFLFLRFTGFFSVSLRVLDFLPFRFFSSYPPYPTF